MTSALRLATLSYAIALVDASLLSWSGGRRDAGNWGPARHTATVGRAAAEINPVGWSAPKPTAPPGAEPFDIELRRQQLTTTVTSAATCGYPASNVNDSAITCSNGEYCYKNEIVGAAGCCGEANRRDCKIPTTCIESSESASVQSNPRTLICNDTAKPHCVTYSYNDNFFQNFDGFTFLACGKVAGASTIATSPPPGWDPTSDVSTTADSTAGTASDPVTVTVFPSSSSSPSSTAAPAASGSGSSSKAGAIAGGVIGGVAGLALIIAAIFFLLRCLRRRKNEMEGKQMESSPAYASRDYGISSVYPGGLPEPQYHSDFYGELPPQMIQTDSSQHVTSYPQPPPASYDPVVPRDMHRLSRPTTTFVPISPKPNDDDIVSPITPGDGLNPADDPATYTWISNPTPPPQSEYSQFSPPPPTHFQSYRPYPGT